MAALIRMFALGLIVLSIGYLSYLLIARERQRRLFVNEWKQQRGVGDCDFWVTNRMRDFDRRQRRIVAGGAIAMPVVMLMLMGIVALANQGD